MSGIYIPGIEMPTRDVTFLVHVNGDTIDLTPPRKYAEEYHREREIYKLIPIPDHGRLIDADKLDKAIGEEVHECAWDNASFSGYRVWDLLDDAPTIIPADKDGAE